MTAKQRPLLILFSILLSVAPACKYLGGSSPVQGEKVVARVNNEYLYLSDISEMLKNVAPKDSADFIANYAVSWARRKLLLKKAEENVPSGELGLDKKVEEYRQSLLLYEYEKGLINQKLDKGVSEAEMAEFYEKNKEKFTLESDLYDIRYVQIRTDAPELGKMLSTIISPSNDEEERRRDGYCKAIAHSYSFKVDNWMVSAAILKQFPISELDLKNLALVGKFTQFKGEKESYFIQVKAVKHAGEAAPIEFIQPQIKEVLINKKKVILIQKIYDKIYDDGVKAGSCEVLVKK